MVITPRTDTTNSLRQINALPNSTGIRTRRGNPNAPAIILQSERGGVKIHIKDSAATEFANTSSYLGSDDSDSNDTDSIISGVPSLTTAPTILLRVGVQLDIWSLSNVVEIIK
ncbi:Retrovirus-related Pol polyprotein from transposon TNT 1-94 [Ceratobasidium sp. AG-Ba]|nr:Retrovirus-related Pol polyprotein from transposon TNT 1-94 [Ceratobasidium sp. AG-Ba]